MILNRELPGISPRVLATRLKELEREWSIRQVENTKSPRVVRWSLTEKGIDTIPLIMIITAFASRHYPSVIFSDNKTRKLHELYDDDAMELILRNP